MGIEVERKWRCEKPELGDERARRIEQGYLVVDTVGGSECRLRDSDGDYTLTVKTGAGLVRGEYETALSDGQFDRLWPATEGWRLAKRRAKVALGGGLIAEVDVYGGTLTGLIIVEVEFADEAAARAFEAPAWFGVEVTGDKRYANRQLAVDGQMPES